MPAKPEPTDRAEVRKLVAAVEAALTEGRPTSYRSADPTVPSWADGPQIGTAPAVAQPGRPAMSQRAVDLNTTLLSASVAIAAMGGAVAVVCWASRLANPVVIGWICACFVGVPAAIALPVLALKGLMKSAKEVVEAAPAEIHHHYSGPVHQDQRNVSNTNRGFGRSTTST
ncbi:hypothetical protein [Streptomyces xanthochromogenes]|uniref:hypothetical protein n=1 Tax=Streptomyces xanthochromogenes TaxID=67384 RepID=UPI002F4035D2